MPVRVLIVVAVVLLACLLLAADRTVKVIRQARRRREAGRRLAAATAQGKAKHRQRKAAEQASGALTSVMPTIHDVETRHVDQPSIQHDGTSSPS
jgi:hypothetical protein